MPRTAILAAICGILALTGQAAARQATTAPPLETLLTGTAKDAISAATTGNTTTYCVLNTTLLPGADEFSDNGPNVSFYQQDSGTGPLTIAFPGIGHGTQVSGQDPTWDYFALGTAQLVFTGSTAGTIAFLPGSVFVPSPTMSPSFSQYSTIWNAATFQLSISFLITLGNCTVTFTGVYSD